MQFVNDLKQGFWELQQNFQEWKLGFNDFYKTFQEFKAGFTKVYNAIDTFFTFFPIEVILLLIFTVFILILLNSISPKTTRINATISVVFICSVWMYFNEAFTGSYKVFTVFKASLYILGPLYAFSILKLLFDFGKRIYYQSKYASSDTAKLLVEKIHDAHFALLKASFLMDKNPEPMILSIQQLKTSVADLEIALQRKKG